MESRGQQIKKAGIVPHFSKVRAVGGDADGRMRISEEIDMDITTIKVQVSTRKALAARGRKGETYDTIIQKMIAVWDEAEAD